jgi:ankyrin repeat protein
MKQLFDAIKAGDAAAVQSLIDAQPALVDATDDNGLNAFTVAKYNRKDDIARLLLHRGAQLDIHSAAMTGDEARIRTLLAADASLAKALSHDGWTPLHLAAFFGHTGAAKALIDNGAPVNERSTNGMANLPLHAAAAGRKVDMVVLLIEHDAAVNARQHGGWTALHAAAQNGDANIVHVLIGAGADVQARADNNQSALDLAMLKGNQEMVDILEHYGAGE